MDAVSFIATSYLVMSAVEAAAWALVTALAVLAVFALIGLVYVGRYVWRLTQQDGEQVLISLQYWNLHQRRIG